MNLKVAKEFWPHLQVCIGCQTIIQINVKKKKNTNVSYQTTNQEIPFTEITSNIGDQQSVERSKDLQQVDMLEWILERR